MMPMKMSEKNRLRTLSYSAFAIITSRAVTQKKGNVAGVERRGPPDSIQMQIIVKFIVFTVPVLKGT